jgi:hypothetical protein
VTSSALDNSEYAPMPVRAEDYVPQVKQQTLLGEVAENLDRETSEER